MTTDRALPGFHPSMIRFDLRALETDDLELRVWAIDDPRYISADQATVYARVTLAEALDVIDASLAGWEAWD